MSETKLEQKYKIIIFIELFTALVFTVYWGAYFSSSLLPESINAYFSVFPKVVPIPDLLLVAVMSLSAFLILAKGRINKGFIYLSAVMLIFLGIAGADFQLQNGMRLVSMVSMVNKGYVNLWCVVFGLYFWLKTREKSNPDKKLHKDRISR